MRGKRAKIETLFQWLRRDENGKKRLREAYKKATPKEQGISYVEEWEWGGGFSSFGFSLYSICFGVLSTIDKTPNSTKCYTIKEKWMKTFAIIILTFICFNAFKMFKNLLRTRK